MSCRFTLHFTQQCQEFFLQTLHHSCFLDGTWKRFVSSQQLCDEIFQIPTWIKDGLPSFENVISNISSESQEKHRLIAFIFVNTMQHPHILKNNTDHSSKRGTLPFFHLDTNPIRGHILVHSVDKTLVAIPTSHCQRCTAFLDDVRC